MRHERFVADRSKQRPGYSPKTRRRGSRRRAPPGDVRHWHLANIRMSAFGTKRTSRHAQPMSAFAAVIPSLLLAPSWEKLRGENHVLLALSVTACRFRGDHN